MLFVGPSGVGKTESAKIIAKEYYQSSEALIKLDMACYQDHTAINKLIGAAPGYQGSDNPTSFVRQIKKHPNSVVLLDEIDKASADVLDFFLNVFDEGYFVDAHNNIVNCRNVMFLMTSNLESESALTKMNFDIGQSKEKKQANHAFKDLLSQYRSEFLNRINYVVEFKPLDIDTAQMICQKYAEKKPFSNETTLEINKKLLESKNEIKSSGARCVSRIILDALLEDINKKNRV